MTLLVHQSLTDSSPVRNVSDQLIFIVSFFTISLRYQAVVLPLSGRGEITNWKLKLIIPGCWLAGFLWNIPLLVTVTYQEESGACGEYWPGPVSPIAYSLGWDVVAGTLPITAMSYWYSKVVCHLWFNKTPGVKSAATVSAYENLHSRKF